jgi:cell division septation protein DedD
MATDNRTPDDLQEAVAATLRRLRGEVKSAGPGAPAQRVEPQFSSPAPGELVASQSEADMPVEPDLLAGTQPEIPLTPTARTAMGEGNIAYQEQAAKSRVRWLPYALSFVALAVFAGIVWWAYHAIVGAPKNGEVAVITADQTPAKVPPADQNATDGSEQEKTVYNQISGANTQPKTEVLLPAPETPQPPPPPATPPTTADAGGTAADTTGTAAGTTSSTTNPTVTTETLAVPPAVPVVPATTGSGTDTTSAQQAATNTTDTGSSTAGTTTAQQSTTQQTASTDTGSSTPAPDVDLSGVPTLAPTMAPTTPVPAATPVTTANTSGADTSGTAGATTQTSTVADNFHIQLAALKTEAEANTTWNRLLAKHNDVLGALTLHIVRADLGTQGIYYRVQAGPFADKASAKSACDKLKTAGQQCLVKP